MRKNRFGIFLLLIAMVFALIAAVGTIKMINSYKNTEYVVVATKEIYGHTVIKEEDLVLKEMPIAFITGDMIREKKEIAGKISRTYIPLDAVITKNYISDLSGEEGIALNLTEKNNPLLRGVGIPADSFVSLGNVEVGDKVDIVGTFITEDEETISKQIAQGVEVIHRDKDKNTFVVAVTPEQFQEIAITITSGELYVGVTPFHLDNKELKQMRLSEMIILEGAKNEESQK